MGLGRGSGVEEGGGLDDMNGENSGLEQEEKWLVRLFTNAATVHGLVC